MTKSGRKEALMQIDRAMVRIRRSQTRRTIGRLMERQLGVSFNPAHSFVVDAIDELDDANEQTSVGTVAERLGIDPSRASRMVASAVRAGHVRRTASENDGRRTCLQLTGSGRKLLQRARSFRADFFSKLMAGWPDADCSEFARLLTKFTEPMPDTAILEPPAQKP